MAGPLCVGLGMSFCAVPSPNVRHAGMPATPGRPPSRDGEGEGLYSQDPASGQRLFGREAMPAVSGCLAGGAGRR